MATGQDAHFIQRALNLAEYGECASIQDVERRIAAEGCTNAHTLLDAGWLRDDLYMRFAAAAKPAGPA